MSWVVNYFKWTAFVWGSSGGPIVYGIVPGAVVLIAAIVGLYLHYDGVKNGGNFFRRVGIPKGDEAPLFCIVLLCVAMAAMVTTVTWMYWLPLVIVLAIVGGAGYGILTLVTSAGKRAKVVEDEKSGVKRKQELAALQLELNNSDIPEALLLKLVGDWDKAKQKEFRVYNFMEDSYRWHTKADKAYAAKQLKERLELV